MSCNFFDSRQTDSALGQFGNKSPAGGVRANAREAEDIATVADVKAQAAQVDILKLRAKVNTLEQSDKSQDSEIQQAKQAAQAALQLGGIALTTAANTAQGLSILQGQIGNAIYLWQLREAQASGRA